MSRERVRRGGKARAGAGPVGVLAGGTFTAGKLLGDPPLRDPDSGGSKKSAPSGNLGRLAFGFLAVCVVSGFALVPFYSPEHALDSLERLQGGLPWGFFLRAVHAFSGFGLLVTTVGHLVQVLAARSERQLSISLWWRSIALLPVVVLALLGGFALRLDAEAVAALQVWRRVQESIPLLGAELARLTLGWGGNDLGAVALHHAGTFTILAGILTAAHAGRLLPDRRSAILTALVSAALAGLVPLPLGRFPAPAPPDSAEHLVLGPWYLLGLQGALVSLPVAVAWLGPALLVLVLGLVRHARGSARSVLLAFAALWVAAYLGFTVRLLLLAGR